MSPPNPGGLISSPFAAEESGGCAANDPATRCEVVGSPTQRRESIVETAEPLLTEASAGLPGSEREG